MQFSIHGITYKCGGIDACMGNYIKYIYAYVITYSFPKIRADLDSLLRNVRVWSNDMSSYRCLTLSAQTWI